MRGFVVLRTLSISMFMSIVCVTTAFAQSLQDSPVIFRSGQWDVHRTRDAMSDATLCTAVPHDNFAIQLTDGMLTIALSDGVKQVQLRFDSADAQPARRATPSEFQNGRIEITGADYAQVLDAKRLRYEASTVSNGAVSGDINLDGVFLAHGNVAAGCAGNPISTRTTADTCLPAMREKMKQKGIVARDIDDICSAK
jgi:hypothetical protein